MIAAKKKSVGNIWSIKILERTHCSSVDTIISVLPVSGIHSSESVLVYGFSVLSISYDTNYTFCWSAILATCSSPETALYHSKNESLMTLIFSYLHVLVFVIKSHKLISFVLTVFSMYGFPDASFCTEVHFIA